MALNILLLSRIHTTYLCVYGVIRKLAIINEDVNDKSSRSPDLEDKESNHTAEIADLFRVHFSSINEDTPPRQPTVPIEDSVDLKDILFYPNEDLKE